MGSLKDKFFSMRFYMPVHDKTIHNMGSLIMNSVSGVFYMLVRVR